MIFLAKSLQGELKIFDDAIFSQDGSVAQRKNQIQATAVAIQAELSEFATSIELLQEFAAGIRDQYALDAKQKADDVAKEATEAAKEAKKAEGAAKAAKEPAEKEVPPAPDAEAKPPTPEPPLFQGREPQCKLQLRTKSGLRGKA